MKRSMVITNHEKDFYTQNGSRRHKTEYFILWKECSTGTGSYRHKNLWFMTEK
jgi:hypothetical protein